MISPELKQRAIKLRLEGMLYSEINEALGSCIPKSTMSGWFKAIVLSPESRKIIDEKIGDSLLRSQAVSVEMSKVRREQSIRGIQEVNSHLADKLHSDADTAKIALVILYMAEGSKHTSSQIAFGNSDPYIIRMFLHLLRSCYTLASDKFRCTVQCRADQNITELEKFWSKITGIPPWQFLKAQVDRRTIGKPTRKGDYKGVCKVNYYSASIYHELIAISKIIYKGP